MRLVYFLSGMPGTGKSTFIAKNGIEALTLSLDTLRHIYSGLQTDFLGNMVLSQDKNDLVYAKFIEALKIRLQLGGIIFIDNLNPSFNDISEIIPIIQSYDYDYRVVEFPLESIDFYFERNKNRPTYKSIPESRLITLHEVFSKREFPADKTMTVEEVEKYINATPEDLMIDVSHYDKIHFIGDLQGSYYPIEKYLNGEKFKENELYVFLGDYIDRGIQNDKCLEFVLKHLNDKNCIFIMGNHEKHLYTYSNNLGRPPSEFLNGTLPQLKKAGFDTDMMKKVYNGLELYAFLKYKDKQIFVSHAGLVTVPNKPRLLNFDEYMKGFGGYSYNVDAQFNKLNEDNNWYQIHGHRNSHKLGFKSYPKSFALEAEVEFGGNLPILILDKTGFNGIYIHNKIFNRDLILREEKEKNMFVSKSIINNLTDFLTSRVNYDKSGLEIITELRENDLIREKTFEDLPHISAFNFKKQAFFDKRFDEELVIHARGLFFNNKTGEIVARGFEKFFNINERGIESAQLSNLEKNLKMPLTLYEKENGFLGLMGYDSNEHSIIYASKSDIGGEFSTYLQNIAKNQFSENELEYMKIYANKHNINYIFEVNDPINDPHIIKYDKAHLVLIGIVKRELRYTEMNYEHLVEFSKSFNSMPIKRRFAKIENFKSFTGFYNAVSKESALTTKRQLEGYVVQDAEMNMVKIKLPFYNFWKCMRGFIEQMKNAEIKDKNFDIANIVNNHFLINEADKPAAIKFLEYIKTIPADQREKDIISLRDEFLIKNEIKIESKPKIKLKQ
ncbi:MAG: metallophosphoesterase [Silvanigrellaceae bacterium]|nr:metallophosphoesterase [Silvanigrellaceae bacterium]